MKKAIVLLGFGFFLISCGNSEQSGTAENGGGAETPAPQEEAMSPEVEKGLNLVAQSDCLTCHQVAQASTGPSYEAVAAKYPDTEENITMLADKIIKGGAGNWGTVPMTPHPTLSQEDAQTMVKYVLSLK